MSFTPVQRRLILVLGFAIAIGPMSIDMYLPALPTLQKDLLATHGQAQLTLSAFLFGLAFGQLFYGPLTDRIGRKKPLYFGLSLYVLASIGCALVQNIESLQLLRLLQAIGGCGSAVVTRAIVRDLFDAQTSAKVASLMMLVMGVAPILAPLAGGYVLLLGGWRWIFAALALFGLVCLLMIWKALPETGRPQSGPRPGYWSVLRERDFLAYALGGGVAQSGMFAYISCAPFVFIEVYQVPPQHFGWLFGVNAVGLIAATQLNGWLLNRYPLTRILHAALTVHAATALVLLAVGLSGRGGLIALLVPLFFVIGSLGLVFPNSSASAMAPFGRQAGTASATLGMIQYGGAATAGALVGLWAQDSAVPMVSVIAICSCSAWVLLKLLAPAVPRQLDGAG